MAIDLHIHTTASDGKDHPAEVVREAKKQGLTAIAITDHDTIDGIVPALAEGEKVGLEVVPGIELNTDYKNTEVHVLGYYLDYTSARFTDKLQELQLARKERGKKMVENLDAMGVHLSYERVKEIAGDGSLGRPHLAQALVEAEYAESWEDAFHRFIGRECPAYVPRTKLTPFSAVELILEVGGIPILAHPGLNNLDEIIPQLIETGLMGIEVYHFEHSPTDVERYLQITEKQQLLVTGGSDYHGPRRRSGAMLGMVRLDDDYLVKLKAARQLEKKI